MKLKRIMAIVLCFAMVLSTMSFNVFAETVTVDTVVALQEAIDAADGEVTITLSDDITGNVTIAEKAGLYLTIDGADKTMYGKIVITSLSDTNDNRRITIKNINFVDNDENTDTDFIASVETNHYPRLTVESCSFTGNGNDKDVAVRLKSSHSVVLKGCTGDGLHSFLQNTAGWNLEIEDITVTNSKGGLALGTVQGVTVKNCNITTHTYGIRIDADTYNNNAVIESNNVAAFIPVVVRKVNTNSDITFTGNNNMTATNTDDIWCAVGKTEYENNGEMPEAPETGKVTITLEDTGLNADGLYDAASVRKGDNFTGYINETSIWGEAWGNSEESFVIKVLDADGNVMGTTSLNDIDGIIDGDVKVTWNIKLDAESNADEYWTMSWTTAPSLTNVPTSVQLWVDGVHVSGGDVILNAPDNIKPVFAAKTDADGNIIRYISRSNTENADTVLATNIANGDNIAILAAGSYSVPSGKNISITGAVDGVVFDNIAAHNMGGANVTFNNVTFNYENTSTYKGLQHSGDLVYNNCTFNGQVFLYGTSETFNNCTFNTTDSNNYNVWTYTAKKVAFNECIFNSAGKSVLIFAEDANLINDVTVTKSSFNASGAVDGKAAIEMDSSLTAGIKLTVDADTTATGFGSGNVSGNSLWNNKRGNEGANNDIVVSVAGETVLAPEHKVATKAELTAAIAAAKDGDKIILTADIDYGTDQLTIEKPIALDLGGFTLTTANNYGGTSLKNNPSIVNGTIKHIGNTAAIKVWNATTFADLTIDVSVYTEGKVKGGIVVQSGSTSKIGKIKNVTIQGAGLTNGIETYNCGDSADYVIGSMENVTINANGTGMLISAPCGTATNCIINGGVTGIELWIKGTYSASLNLVNCDVKGEKLALYVHDEFTSNPSAVNNGKIGLVADENSTFTASDNGKALEYVIERADEENITLSENIAELITLNGYGTEAEPYLIKSVADLVFLRNDVNNGNSYKGKFIKLTADLDLANLPVPMDVNAINGWTPIGIDKNTPFMGNFDGNSHIISNLKVEGENNQGFFGYATESTIKNLTFKNVSVKGTNCVGAVVGQAYASTHIDNCKVTGLVRIEGLTNVGGITGKYYARVTNCFVDGGEPVNSYVTGVYKQADLEGDNIGGIMGHAGENNTHSGNTVKNITISGTRKVGGLIGTTDRATDLSNCNVENVSIICTASADYALNNASTTTLGGLVGNYYGDSTGGTITDCAVTSVAFTKGNATNVGAVVGGVRTAPDATEVAGVTANNIDINNVTGTTNGLFVPASIYAASADGIRYTTIEEAIKNATAEVVIFAGTFNKNLTVNKAITVRGETDANGVNVVNFNGKLSITADGAKVKNLNFNNPGDNAGYINAKDVLVEGCTVVGGNGFRYCYANGLVTFKNSTITGSTYGIHFDGSAGGEIVIDNCVITGWTSFAGKINKVTINKTKFAEGNYNQLRFYQNCEITDTTFNPNMTVDFGKNNVECNITNSTVSNGSPVTDVIYLGDIAQMGVKVTVDSVPVTLTSSITSNGNTSYYLTLQEAVDAANAGDTITVIKDFETSDTVTIAENKDIIIDLNEKTITAKDEKTSANYELLYNYGKLTVKNGTINLSAATDRSWNNSSSIFHNRGGELVIESGEYTHLGGTSMAYVVDNSGNSYGDATTVVNGGTLKSSYIAIRNRMDTYGVKGGGNGIASPSAIMPVVPIKAFLIPQ